MATTTDDLEATQLRIATECQQNFYEIFNDWYRFKSNERDYLETFIGCVLVGPPNYEKSENDDRGTSAHFSYDSKQREAINLVLDKIIEYGRGENSDAIVLCGIVYNVIYNKEQSLNVNNNMNYMVGKMKAIEPVAQVYPVPVFKVRNYRSAEMEKEKKDANKSSAERTYYIDNGGRVYDAFLDYLENNTLPKCTMVVPKDGRYQADPVSSNIDNLVSRVWIDVHQSPASKVASKVLLGGDIASTVVGLASIGVGIAAIITPIGAKIKSRN